VIIRALLAVVSVCALPHSAHCVVKKHHTAVTTMYYQNASRVGGTALAGYPLLRVGYGVTSNLEAFYDAPSELAVSAHGPHYEMTHSGIGATAAVAQDGNVDFLLTAQSRPPLSPLANLYVLPLSDLHLTVAWSELSGTDFSAQVGTLNFIATNRGHRRSSVFDSLTGLTPIGNGTWFSGQLGMQSNATYGSAGETRGIASLKRAVGANTLFNVDLGTAFNAGGNSKPHYLGAGFTFLH
jgi:hypothetical protein